MNQVLESAETRLEAVRGGSEASHAGERQRWRIVDAIREEAERHGYDPLFVMAIIEVEESTCSPTANFVPAAVGLTQIKPFDGARGREGPRSSLGRSGRVRAAEPQHPSRSRLPRTARGEVRRPVCRDAAYNLGPERASRMSRQHAKRAHYVKKVMARAAGRARRLSGAGS
ncbi:MAG: hypothetical protein U1E86_28695 [Burkholderiaceae bacterium]